MPEVAPLPALKNGFITFGCFNNPTKVNAVLLGEWAKLLHAVPESRLFLKSGAYDSPDMQRHVLETLEKHGISPERVRFEGYSVHYKLFERYNEVDIALDPWPYSGGLTTCEAMLMGVPVITLPGPTFAGRHSATHLTNAGMPELVVSNWDEYRARAVELTSDLQSLSTIRRHLRQILLESVVCDGAKFARHLADALRAIWQRYCEGKTPAALAFTPAGQPWFEDEDAPVALTQPEPAVATATTPTDFGHDFSFQGKIVALDHGATLVNTHLLQRPTRLGALTLVAIDPASNLANVERLKYDKQLDHYQAHIALGDGEPGVLYTCLEKSLTGTLEPLPPAKQIPFLRDRATLLAKLPIGTTRLDNIDGLDKLDWLLLNDAHDNRKIIQGGENLLASTLVVHVRVLFVDLYKKQPDLACITKPLTKLGFRLLRLDNQRHGCHLPNGQKPQGQGQTSQLVSADAIFVPTEARLKTLDENQRRKLAFILHTAYGVVDLTAAILESIAPDSSKSYLQSLVPAQAVSLQSRREGTTAQLDSLMTGLVATAPRAGKPHDLPAKLVVSLTSYPKRFPTLHLTLRCLLNQSVKADRVVLWIAQQDKDRIPQEVLDLKQYGLEIKYCDDLRSYKKIIPMLREEPSAYIVTADDDIYYPNDWLQRLVDGAKADPGVIVAWRAHKIKLDSSDKVPVPYHEWEWGYNESQTPSALIFPTGVGGVLYPPHAFHKDVLDTQKFLDLAPDADDVWLYWMWRLNGKTARVVGQMLPFLHWPGSQGETLWSNNLGRSHNDDKIRKMIAVYGFNAEQDSALKKLLIDSQVTFSMSSEPLVSVVIPAYNVSGCLARAVDSVLTQTLQDFEILIIDDASTDITFTVAQALASRDPRVRIFRQDVNQGPAAARNRGIDKAKGEWIAVLDADDIIYPNRLENLLSFAASHNADAVADDLVLYDNGADRTIGSAFHWKEAHKLSLDLLLEKDVFMQGYPLGWIQPLYNRDFLLKNHLRYPVNYRHAEDFYLLASILLSGANFWLSPTAEYVYTMRQGPVSGQSSPFSASRPNWNNVAESCREFIDQYREKLNSSQIQKMEKRANRFNQS
jgi:glycosyltransferase involved in cell wall biosynthesis